MDPSGDLHYERDGIPLTGRNLTDAYWKNKVKGLFIVSSDGTKIPLKKSEIECYRGYSIDLASNQLSKPVTVIVNGKEEVLRHKNDFHDYPAVGHDDVGIKSAFLAWENSGFGLFQKTRPESGDPDDFSYRKNQSLIFLGRVDASHGWIKVILQKENSETYEKFLCKIDKDDWQDIPADEVLWELRPGLNKMAVRIQTHYNWQGPISRAIVFYKPSYLLWPKKAV